MIMPKFILISIMVLSLQSWSSVNLEAVAQEKVPVMGNKVKVDYIQIEEKKGKKKEKREIAEGELLAVSPDTLYVSGNKYISGEQGVFAIENVSVRKIEVELYPSGSGKVVLWTVLGTLSTASHGIGLILSAPVWIIVGTICSATLSASNDREFSQFEFEWEELRQYARYPQGLPPNFQPPK